MDTKEIKQKVLEDADPILRKKKRMDRIKSWIYTVMQFVILVTVIFVVFRILIGMSPIEGDSMYPTLHDKNTVFYNRVTKNYMRNDIVAIQRPHNELFVKRIVAVAGDTVNIEKGAVYINGKREKEIAGSGSTENVEGGVVFPVTVKEGEVFVLGDNRQNSEDSRMFGTVSTDDLLGKLVWYAGRL